MPYSVKEIFYTLQGEGANVGTPAVFCRFSGCNLWTGREQDRHSAVCQFCDTDFVGADGDGGGKFASPQALAQAVAARWPTGAGNRFVVCTGGEPALQLDDALVEALHEAGFRVAIETNGTLPLPADLDWVCVSPKAGTAVVVRRGNELKFVYPQVALDPEDCADWDFEHRFLQPMDGPRAAQNTRQALDYCLADPRWRLSIQTHKLLGIR
jgi:7-carboxy-7-deazaguanine synthase (Cx14CxxC type)